MLYHNADVNCYLHNKYSYWEALAARREVTLCLCNCLFSSLVFSARDDSWCYVMNNSVVYNTNTPTGYVIRKVVWYGRSVIYGGSSSVIAWKLSATHEIMKAFDQSSCYTWSNINKAIPSLWRSAMQTSQGNTYARWWKLGILNQLGACHSKWLNAHWRWSFHRRMWDAPSALVAIYCWHDKKGKCCTHTRLDKQWQIPWVVVICKISWSRLFEPCHIYSL